MITARSLTKRYGRTLAVQDLSFTVAPGAVTGFLGPNGSGKSTTMRMVMGLDAPDGGSATVNGTPYAGLRWPLREVGALLDARAFHPARSARDHLRVLARTNDVPPRRVDEVLEQVGLTEVAGVRAGKFSLGMGQRLGIAAALLGDPGVLLFDEPVNGLDPEGIRWARTLLRNLAAEGRTVFVSSHLISEMALTAERVVVIGKGRLIADTTVEALSNGGTGPAVRVVTPTARTLVTSLLGRGAKVRVEDDGAVMVSGMTAVEVGEVAAQRSLTLHELTPVRASLEDAFMQLTSDAVEYRTGDPPDPPWSPPTRPDRLRAARAARA
ncbi:MAG: ATP-binding cassette domain-containing protein, partial [Acidimicrobiales bacterium]